MLISKKQKDLQCCYKSVQHSAFWKVLRLTSKRVLLLLFTVVNAVSAEEKYADNMSKIIIISIFTASLGPKSSSPFVSRVVMDYFPTIVSDWMNIVKFCLFQVSVKSA